MTNSNATWAGMVPVDDTALSVTETRGSGTPILYLNGSYTSQSTWRPVIDELGGNEWRHITYDERARGKSQRSADYSFEACIRDVDAVLDATKVQRGTTWPRSTTVTGKRAGNTGRPGPG